MRISDAEMRAPTDLPFHKAQPYRIKVVEYTRPTTRAQRKELLKQYGWSAPNLPAEYVYINMVTDSGTSAMSDRQWSAMLVGDESYFNCRSWYNLEAAIKEMTGFEHVLPCHQGRSGEAILYELLVHEGQIVPSNTHFTTTRAHCYSRGAEPLDLLCQEYYDSERTDVFKGNIDTDKLRDLLKQHADKIPAIELVMPNNLNAGQPVSMANLKEVREIADKYGKLVFLDIARLPENAFMVKRMEQGYAEKTCAEIVRESCSYADVLHMSSKKSGLVNIGGFVAVRDYTIWQRLHPKLIRTDGFMTYGGLAGRDLEALAVGLIEGMNDYYLMDRQRQVEYFGNALKKRGVAIYEPASCFAVFINAGKCLPHLKPMEGPGSALASQAYIEGGLGITPFDSLHRGRENSKDPLNEAKVELSPFELIRCAMPRRVYTEAHYEVAADAVEAAMKHGEKIPAYHKMEIHRPPIELKDIGLRPFFNEFEPLGDHP